MSPQALAAGHPSDSSDAASSVVPLASDAPSHDPFSHLVPEPEFYGIPFMHELPAGIKTYPGREVEDMQAVGKGGMGAVFLASHMDLGGVVVKTLVSAATHPSPCGLPSHPALGRWLPGPAMRVKEQDIPPLAPPSLPLVSCLSTATPSSCLSCRSSLPTMETPRATSSSCGRSRCKRSASTALCTTTRTCSRCSV
jgi:hypothetical protein